MLFDPQTYGNQVAGILALGGNGSRPMPLAGGKCSSAEARKLMAAGARPLFPQARAPEAALAGLYLYFSCWDEAHETAQAIETAEGSYWHAIVHRQEPDAGNSIYWFRRTGRHAIFEALHEEAARVADLHAAARLRLPQAWDPFWFIEVCERARSQPGSDLEIAAMEIQRAEWQLLFDYCAAVGRPAAGRA